MIRSGAESPPGKDTRRGEGDEGALGIMLGGRRCGKGEMGRLGEGEGGAEMSTRGRTFAWGATVSSMAGGGEGLSCARKILLARSEEGSGIGSG